MAKFKKLCWHPAAWMLLSGSGGDPRGAEWIAADGPRGAFGSRSPMLIATDPIVPLGRCH
jgi:hypothetical protein